MKPEKPSECTSCGCEERWLLHNVRLRGIYHRLCTSCVLKLHPGLFCPVCFEVYEGSSLPVDRVMCLRCPSVPHSGCVTKEVASCYICPPCLNPNFVFFNSGALNMSRSMNGDSVMSGDRGAIDVKSARVLLAAAQIASISMSKAAAIVRMEADRRVKEAALARKRAREALQRISGLALKEKGEGKDSAVVDKAPNPLLLAEQKKRFKGTNACPAAMLGQKRLENHSVGVLVPSNNVSSEEKERLVGFCPPNAVQRVPNNGVPVDERDILKGSTAPVPQLNKTGSVTELSDQHNNVLQGETEKNGLFSVPPASGPLQHLQNSTGTEERIKLAGNQVTADLFVTKSNN